MTTAEAKKKPALQAKYDQEIVAGLKERFGIANDLAVPMLKKIVINMGVSGAVENKTRVEIAARDMGTIAGQKPTIRNARNSISGFKLREGMPIGCAVTLRRGRMWEFAERLISVVVPRIRDFRGISPKSFDGRGNFAMGVTEQIIFPEIDYDKIDKIRGMDITITTTARTNEEGLALLKAFNFPFKG